MKMATSIVLILGLTAFSFIAGSPLSLQNTRIIGGIETKIEEVPYQLELQRSSDEGRWSFSCGAVIVNKEWVVSAGHCADGFNATSIRFLSGQTVLGSGAVHTIEYMAIHPNFTNNIGWGDNDVAVFKVTPAFEFSNTTQPIELAQEEPAFGANGTISGWGVTSLGVITLILNKGTIPISDKSLCAQAFAELGVDLSDAMLCAGYLEGGVGTCFGDSGGPIVVDGKLVGLTSFGMGCAEPGYPDVFSNIANLLPWIQEQINDLS